MNCTVHSDVEAIGTCSNCGRNMCNECKVDVQGRLVCRTCLASGMVRPATAKDPNTAFLLEFLGGFFGLLGVGWLYAGKTNDGVVRLILWMIFLTTAWVITSLLMAVLVGLLCIPIMLAIQGLVPLWSANELKKQMNSVI